jgi:3-dehydroquinate synthase
MNDNFEHIKVATHSEDADSQGYTIYAGPLEVSWLRWFRDRQYSRLIIICDEHTEVFCLPVFLTKSGIESYSLIRTISGETHKTIQGCEQIWTEMMKCSADRKSLCINLGGGVIGDMGGFCAATFKRGFDFVQIPTTLLAQVDASVGGKLGVDFNSIKNGIGIFKNPEAVFIDTAFLHTLPETELRCAYSEMLKHTLLGSEKEWESISAWRPTVDNQLLARIVASIKIKKSYFDKDPFERNIRKSLNLGHTIGHAIESYFLNLGKPILHGEAVAAGLICELYLSVVCCGFSTDVLDKSAQALSRMFPALPISESIFDELMVLMIQDKKNNGQQINFTLLERIGKPRINQNIDDALILSSLKFYIKNHHK